MWERFGGIGVNGGRSSVVGIATGYGMGGPVIWPRGVGRDFLHPFRPAVGPTQSAHRFNGYRLFCSSVKRPWCDVCHPATSSAEVKERVELCLCSPFVPSWQVIGWYLPITLTFKGGKVAHLQAMKACERVEVKLHAFLKWIRDKR
jgi:hypothetical protein